MEQISAGISRIIILAKRELGFAARIRYLFGKLPLFAVQPGGPMDPITAIFNFLSTAEGQKLMEPLTKVEADIVVILSDLIKKVHNDVTAAAPKAAA